MQVNNSKKKNVLKQVEQKSLIERHKWYAQKNERIAGDKLTSNASEVSKLYAKQNRKDKRGHKR